MTSSYYFCFLLVMSFFHLCLSTRNFNHVLCKDVERRALLEFKHGLIDQANKLASWVGKEKECCSWAGIVCHNLTGHVHQIRLRGVDYMAEKEYSQVSKQKLREGEGEEEEEEVLKEMLGGDLSPSLLQLQQLVYLDLSCNDFGGIQVPSFMGSLKNLRYLNLSSSNFGQIIPPQLGNLSKLEVLDLGRSFDPALDMESMSNIQWLSSLRLLHYLDMSGVKLYIAFDWFQVINTLPCLAELHLSDCQLLDAHHDVSSLNITSLSLLDLSYNEFSHMPRWIFSTTSLVSLDLRWCYFHGPTPTSSTNFRNLTSLELLHVSGNGFMNSSLVLKGLSSVGGKLISLEMSYCDVSSSVLNSLHNLTSLRSLDLSHNQLTKAIPKSLGNFCNLREIDFSSNNFHNISLTYFLESFLECKSSSLESLILKSLGLSGHLPDQLGQLIHLVHLNLMGNIIVGIIPNWIGGLSLLEILDLSHNRLKSSLPASLGQLLELDQLDLSYNQLNGNLPDSLGQLSKLGLLDLSNNQLNGNLPDSLCQLSKLVVLDLSYNKLNGSLPGCLGHLSKLYQLDLSDNQLNGSLPHSLGQLSKLHSLDLSSNLLTGIVREAHFANLTGLKYLNGKGNNLIFRPELADWIPPFQLQSLILNSWGLGPEFPTWLQSQRGLRGLDISNTNISEPLPHLFWRSFPKLIYLDMSRNHIRGTLFNVSTPLYALFLSSNNFTGPLPAFPYGSMLIDLDLSYNFFSGSLHDFFCHFDGIWSSSPFNLNLGNNHLTGVIPERSLMDWQYLRSLNLENNNLSGKVPRNLGFLSFLYSLNLRGNKFSGRLPASLMNLRNLRLLQLGRNELVGSIPIWLGTKLRSLRSLDLRSNNFDGNIPQELCYLTKIHILDLAHNNLSGNIPRCFNNFSILSGRKENRQFVSYELMSFRTTPYLVSESLVMKGQEYMYNSILGLIMMMDLSSNNFVGHIPSQLTALRELKSLNLSRNQLTGRIPEKIGDMKSLESFDLSLNNLSGELPMSLSSLGFLSNFNVSNNSFTGRIPSSTQLQSFGDSSFSGNNLYGDPLTKPCVVAVPVPYRDQEENSGVDWGLIISMVFGFVAGFWIILAPLIVSRSWRVAYFRLLTRLGYLAYDVMHKYCCKMFHQ